MTGKNRNTSASVKDIAKVSTGGRKPRDIQYMRADESNKPNVDFYNLAATEYKTRIEYLSTLDRSKMEKPENIRGCQCHHDTQPGMNKTVFFDLPDGDNVIRVIGLGNHKRSDNNVYEFLWFNGKQYNYSRK